MANLKTYTVLNENNQIEEVFPSTTCFAKHLGISVARLNHNVGKRSMITHEMYQALHRLSYELPDYSNRGQNRKKGVKNK